MPTEFQHNSLTGADLHVAGPVTVDLDLTDQTGDPTAPASGHHALYTKGGGLYLEDPTSGVKGPFIDLADVPLGQPLGLTGATAATRYVGATASGAPVSGTFAVGDFVIDQTGSEWVCTAAGTPGTWTQLGAGGGSDHKLLVASDDTTPDYLLAKLAAGSNITLTKLNAGADEQVQIAASGGGGGGGTPAANAAALVTAYNLFR